MKPVAMASHERWRGGMAAGGERALAEEVAVAFTYNRVTHAVMMATPADLEDFGVGFSITEGIVREAAEIENLAVVETPAGIEVRIDLPAARMDALQARRRTMAGPAGCGMCGLDSLRQAMRPVPQVANVLSVTAEAVERAVAAMPRAQQLNRETGAVHAAGFADVSGNLLVLREDIGRHNALDKLAGALARSGRGAGIGILALTSRVSVELVQKAAMIGAPVIAAVSAPTALAVRTAEAAGIALVGVARDDGFELFSGTRRVARKVDDDVA